MQVQLLAAVTATNSPPSGANAGVAIRGPRATGDALHQPKDDTNDEVIVLVESVAGSAVMTVTIRLWGWSDLLANWFPLGVGSAAAPDTARGVLNAGNPIGEITTDLLQHAEIVHGLGHFQRVYAEVVAIGGTATAVDVWLIDGVC